MKLKLLIATSLLLLLSNGYCQQLVMPGDHPDPSAVKIGKRYYASSTTSNWAPAFPVMESKDMVHWKQIGNVFTDLPTWADFYFWAPEISYDNGKVYIYYAAHKKGGNLCIGIASADKPEGPYLDHGPIMCQPDGSIDAFPMRDEKGKLYLIWKEDANSVGKPTPIWAIQLNEERTATIGEKKELFQNDKVWEHNLVEGVSMIRHGEYFYAFYAAAGCCGSGCSYQTGVARSKNLLGPWEKYSDNPVISNEGEWICPGHGTPVEKDGRYYFIYHAYDKQTNIYTGRQALIKEFRFTPGGWIEFVNDTRTHDVAGKNYKTSFKLKKLPNDWEWSVFQKPVYHLKAGELSLSALPYPGSFIARKTVSGNYAVSTKINSKKSTASAGVAMIGDEKNMISMLLENNSISVHEWRNGRDSILFEKSVSRSAKMSFRIEVKEAKNAIFYYAPGGNHGFQQLNAQAVDASYLPPWDRAVRVGLIASGSGAAVFDNFRMTNH